MTIANIPDIIINLHESHYADNINVYPYTPPYYIAKPRICMGWHLLCEFH